MVEDVGNFGFLEFGGEYLERSHIIFELNLDNWGKNKFVIVELNDF